MENFIRIVKTFQLKVCKNIEIKQSFSDNTDVTQLYSQRR